MKIITLALLLAFKSLYWKTNERKSKYYWELPIDKKIPLIPIFIIPYLFYFIYTAIAIVALWSTKWLYPFFIATFIAYVIALLFWYFVPNGVKRPVIKENGFFHRALRHMYTKDGDTNGFPSAHVFVALICMHYLILAYPANAFIIALGGILICASTVFTKQHYIIDVPGGAIVYIASVYLSQMLYVV
jgi:membrane-associated phospholipid phosphatase